MLHIFKDKLSIYEICERWSQESTESWDDILAFLEGAWWRGEIKWESGATRLELLKHMFNWAHEHNHTLGRIKFVTREDASLPRGDEQPDGGLRFDGDLLRVRIIVPSYDPGTWSEASCASAFQTLAEKPSKEYYPECTPGFLASKLARAAFVQLLIAHGIDWPRFWKLPIEQAPPLEQAPDATSVSRAGPGQPSRKQPSPVAMRKRGRRPIKFEQVREAIKRDVQAGKLTDASLRDMLEKNLADTYGVSRDTARKARTAVLSEFVENSNCDK